MLLLDAVRFRRLPFLFWLCIFCVYGCGGPMKQGQKFFEAGLYERAVQQFEMAARKKPNDVKIQSLLEQSREKAAEVHYAKALQAEENEDWVRAASEYKTVLRYVQDYKDTSKRLQTAESADALGHYQQGIALQQSQQWDSAIGEFQAALELVENYKDSHQKIQEVKESAAEEHYQAAVSFEAEEQWTKALQEFERTSAYVSGYKDVATKVQNAKTTLAEIAYQNAVKLTETAEASDAVRDYRQALKGLESCLAYQPNYKDARVMRDKVKKGATISVCIMPFESSDKELANYVTREMVSSALKNKPELMMFVDRQYVAGFIRGEQSLANLGAINASSAAQMGRLANIHAIVVGQVSYTSEEIPAQSTQKVIRHYSKLNQVKDGQKSVYFDQVDVGYSAWSKSNKVNLQLNFQILNAIDGSIVDSDTISVSSEDQARWVADWNHPSNLTKFSLEQVVGKATRQERVTSSREPKTHKMLRDEAVNQAVKRLTQHSISKVDSLFW